MNQIRTVDAVPEVRLGGEVPALAALDGDPGLHEHIVLELEALGAHVGDGGPHRHRV